MTHDLTYFRRLLEARRGELQANLKAGEDAARPVTLDQASVGRLSRMDSIQAQAMAQASQERRRRELARIEHAIRRIEAGEFGYCAACGEQIAQARLELDPALHTCIRCAGAPGS